MVLLNENSNVDPDLFPGIFRWDSFVRRNHSAIQEQIDQQTYQLQRTQRYLFVTSTHKLEPILSKGLWLLSQCSQPPQEKAKDRISHKWWGHSLWVYKPLYPHIFQKNLWKQAAYTLNRLLRRAFIICGSLLLQLLSPFTSGLLGLTNSNRLVENINKPEICDLGFSIIWLGVWNAQSKGIQRTT